MPKGASGKGNAAGGAPVRREEYSGVTTFANVGSAYREHGPNFTPEANPAIRVLVDRVTGGSEKQASWATTIKTDQMKKIDEMLSRAAMRAAENGEARLSGLYVQARNEAMASINRQNDARAIIDSRDQRVQAILRRHTPEATLKQVEDEEKRASERARK